jgi:Tfp pilus assembly protein PilX
MRHPSNANVTNEAGFALITTLLILALLTFIGLMGINTTSFELKIAGNERQANQRFYTSDSGWKQSGPYLNALASPPDFKNTTLKSGDTAYDWSDEYYLIVRNYGNGNNATLNNAFPSGTEDGNLSEIPYWYRVRYENDFQALKFGANYRDFQYEVISNANGEAQVMTTVRKVYRVGY